MVRLKIFLKQIKESFKLVNILMSFYEESVFPHLNNWVTSKFKRYREELISNSHGEVLEIGFGSGLNLPFYSDQISKIHALEPSTGMIENMKFQDKRVHIINAEAEQIPLQDNSIDTVVSFLVLCTVHDLDKSLSEIKRVLKPNGKLLFFEHVNHQQGFKRSIFNGLNPIWKPLACGCNLTRDTISKINELFQVDKIEKVNSSIPIFYGSASIYQ